MSHIKQLLQGTRVDSLLPSGPRPSVVEILSTELPAAAFQKLLDNDILSAPVYDVEAAKYTGFLDLRDLVSFTVYLYDEQQDPDDPLADTRILNITNPGPAMFKNFVDGVNVKYLSRRNPFRAVQSNATLAEVCKILATGVRRVPVLSEVGRVAFIISQASINRFLVEHTKDLMGETAMPLGSLTIGHSPVLSVPPETCAIDTFRLMDNKHISGVAIIDNSGHTVANTSSRDLKLFVKNPARGILTRNITDFLKELRQNGEETPVITCTEDDTLADALFKICSSNVHRIYVLDSKGFTQRVITLTDVMKYIV